MADMADTQSVSSISTRNEPPQTFKLLLIGNSSVGKSSLLVRFTDNDFLAEEDANATLNFLLDWRRWVCSDVTLEYNQRFTLHADFKVKYIQIKDKRYKLSIWDTAGQERFRTLTSSYYRGAQGVILVYDFTNRESFDKLRVWFQELNTYSTSDAIKIIVGNKTDLDHHRKVSTDEAKSLAENYNAMFVECSAKLSTGVNDLFHDLVQKIIDTPSLHNPIPKPTGAFFDSQTGSVRISDSNTFSRYCSC
ncbi:hypothetical protein E3P92_00037 [Wallemia ichthyophaga]|uniref:Ras-related protein Rab-18 n=1 Tax=Wallemia ichthyophaga TaxID=245174 RepID=A0A4T0K5U3_WALIC|nr:hypothetical protein E3P97_00037 [Wallemia ichthyophaga]TIA98989.1 hypothetical protein E3P96_03017 [Wallemia ichthyophaga]TIB19237.1 hypothetical protein E3P92_00037 [Wallemia ichthyophaga]TIB36214.1 hypothetical protein E3P85_00131 [Wallemia ichthyophaga]TIB37735.1 hypothetical protein E3P84_00037 [Wallemia ichthyophaga]